jgi:hypothetical protein
VTTSSEPRSLADRLGLQARTRAPLTRGKLWFAAAIFAAILAAVLFGRRPPWLDRFEDDARARRGLPPRTAPATRPAPAPAGGAGTTSGDQGATR